MFNPSNIPLSLYVHIPWCVRKCPYCDFNSHALEKDAPETEYVAALLEDFRQEWALANNREIGSIFFGGGTPSLMSASAIHDILAGINDIGRLAPDAEITLEANPGNFEQQRFRGFAEAGVNRLSIGIQSFNQEHLQKLGRIHSADEALLAADVARGAGIDNFNLDLMFALPSQSVDQAVADMRQAIKLAPTHISHYQLTLEPNTIFAKYPPALPEDDQMWQMQEQCQALLTAAGYLHYETSAYAQAGQQAKHNLNYWHFGDYLGIGAGAHGKITLADKTIVRRSKKKAPDAYLKQISAGEAIASEAIEAKQLPFEYMLNRLRLATPLSLSEFEQTTGLAASSIQNPLDIAVEKGLLKRFVAEQQPEAQAASYQITQSGRNFLNDLIELFMP